MVPTWSRQGKDAAAPFRRLPPNWIIQCHAPDDLK
jgi:hypothetical protein